MTGGRVRTRAHRPLLALALAASAVVASGCSSHGGVTALPEGNPAGLTARQLAFAERIARVEVAKEGSHLRVATAQLRPGRVRQSNTGHRCTSGTLLRVTLVGSFPHTTVSPALGHSATVHAEIVDADPGSGLECLIGVETGHVEAPPGATRLRVVVP